ncbi:MAG: hypothetical protein R3E60_06980 [Alphaproteobacteria bacterium]
MTEQSAYEGFSERFSLCAEGRNLAALARAVGVTPAMMNNYKKGSIPDAVIGAKLAAELDVYSEWLFLGKGPMRPGILDPNWPEMPQIQNDLEAILKSVVTEIIAYDLNNGWPIVPKEIGERTLAMFRLVYKDRQKC